ncbi:hypothetical protein FRC00_004632 [Tulasnella sp. 408]|nr:hypothetical protein FRC00_004632 [Tulasnella sp. 408]
MVAGQGKHNGTRQARGEERFGRRIHEEVSQQARAGVAQVGLSGCKEVRGSVVGGQFFRSAVSFDPAQALSRINTATFNPLVATAELFSAFTRVHDSIKQTQLQVVIDNWNEVVKTEDWAIAKEEGKAQPDPYFAGVICEILEASLFEEVYETCKYFRISSLNLSQNMCKKPVVS